MTSVYLVVNYSVIVYNKHRPHKPGRIRPSRASISQKDFSSSLVMMRRYPAIKFIPCRSRNSEVNDKQEVSRTHHTSDHRTPQKLHRRFIFNKKVTEESLGKLCLRRTGTRHTAGRTLRNYFALQIGFRCYSRVDRQRPKEVVCVRETPRKTK